MKIVLQFFAVVLLLLTQRAFAASDMVQLDIPAEAAAPFAEAEKYRDAEKFISSYSIYTELKQKYPGSFSIVYGYGRLLAQMKRFVESAEVLNSALKLGKSNAPLPDPSIYNTIGWVATMNGNFDLALEYFKKTSEDQKIYSRLSDETRMKLHNNTGYALMLLDRYEESMKEFRKAEQLGSEKAKANIEKVTSLIETQKKQNENIPGVFAVVVLSTRSTMDINKVVQTISSRLHGILPEQDLKTNVYLAKTGLYFIALGGNYSYAKAQRIHGAVKNIIADAFVSSTTSWTPYSIGIEQVPAANALQQEQRL